MQIIAAKLQGARQSHKINFALKRITLLVNWGGGPVSQLKVRAGIAYIGNLCNAGEGLGEAAFLFVDTRKLFHTPASPTSARIRSYAKVFLASLSTSP
jgi:hypothetical protein